MTAAVLRQKLSQRSGNLLLLCCLGAAEHVDAEQIQDHQARRTRQELCRRTVCRELGIPLGTQRKQNSLVRVRHLTVIRLRRSRNAQLFRGAAQNGVQLCRLDGLEQIIQRTQPHGGNGIFKFIVGADNNHLCLRLVLMEPLHQLKSVMLRHADIRDDDLRAAAPQAGNGLLDRLRLQNLINIIERPVCQQTDRAARGLLIVNNQCLHARPPFSAGGASEETRRAAGSARQLRRSRHNTVVSAHTWCRYRYDRTGAGLHRRLQAPRAAAAKTLRPHLRRYPRL